MVLFKQEIEYALLIKLTLTLQFNSKFFICYHWHIPTTQISVDTRTGPYHKHESIINVWVQLKFCFSDPRGRDPSVLLKLYLT